LPEQHDRIATIFYAITVVAGAGLAVYLLMVMASMIARLP